MNRKQFTLISIFWIVLLTGFILYSQLTIWTGTEVLLKTRPIDPFDIFRGEYVTLSYEISDLSSIPTKGNESIRSGDTIYIVLTQNGEIAEPVYKTNTLPTDEPLFIKGKVRYNDTAEYGIESFFLPEGEAIELERAQGDDMEVKVVIDKQGRAILRSIIHNGNEIKTPL